MPWDEQLYYERYVECNATEATLFDMKRLQTKQYPFDSGLVESCELPYTKPQ